MYQEKPVKPLKDLNLLDRFLFAEAMEDTVVCTNMLEIILGSNNISLLDKIQTEKELRTSLLLRSVRVDVWAMDEQGTIYNSEMQGYKRGNLRKRSRYYQALLDSGLLEPGVVDFDILNDSFMIFISPFVVFGLKKYLYTFQMRCDEESELALGDGAVRIFLNTNGNNKEDISQELVELLGYIEHSTDTFAQKCTSSKVREIHEHICRIKMSEKIGVKYMNAWEEKIIIREEGKAEGITEVIIDLLRDYGDIPQDLREKIKTEDNINVLKEWLKKAIKTGSMEQFQKAIQS